MESGMRPEYPIAGIMKILTQFDVERALSGECSSERKAPVARRVRKEHTQRIRNWNHCGIFVVEESTDKCDHSFCFHKCRLYFGNWNACYLS